LITVVWRFEPKPARREEFERAYGRDGAWARLFSRDPAYVETILLRDAVCEGSYLCMDKWTSLSAYEAFKEKHRAEYEALDRECESLTAEEIRIGIFED